VCLSLFPISLFLVHNSTIIAEHSVKTLLTISPCHDYQLTPSTAYTEYSIHRVQHTPSTAYTQDCLSSLHSYDYLLTLKCSCSFRCASLHDRLPSSSAPWELEGKVVLSHSHSCELTIWWKETQHLVHRPSTSCQYSPTLTWLRPLSSHDHGFQLHQLTRSITISESISKVSRSQPPCVSPNTLNHHLHVHLQSHSITVSTLARSQTPSVSPNSLGCGLQTRSITASKCIPTLPWLWPRSASPTSLGYGLQTRSIMASKCISKLARSRPPSYHHHGLQVYLHIPSITISECISRYTRSRTRSVSPIMLDYGLQVHLQTCSTKALECISEFTWSSFSGTLQIALKHRLQPVQIYCV